MQTIDTIISSDARNVNNRAAMAVIETAGELRAVQSGEPLHRFLSNLPAHAVAVRFADDRGRNCAVILEHVGNSRRPHGWCARLAIDDGKVCDSTYLGRLQLTRPDSREVVGAFTSGTVPDGITTADEMRDALIAHAREVADMATVPFPVPAAFAELWK